MAGNITTPERGQPIDVEYLANIADQIIRLNNTVSSNVTQSYIGGAPKPTAGVSIVAREFQVPSGKKTINASDRIEITFDKPFQVAPIVILTIVLKESFAANYGIRIFLRESLPSKCSAEVKYDIAGDVNYNINLLAVGFSSN